MAWVRRRYRAHKVWILADESGEADLDDRGLARLRYKQEDEEHTYTVRPAEISPLEGTDAAAAPAPNGGEASPIRVWFHVEGPTPMNDAAVGIVLRWRDRHREILRVVRAGSTAEARLAAATEVLRAIRKPAWPVRVHHREGTALDDVLAEDGPIAPTAADALRALSSTFADLSFAAPGEEDGPLVERAAALARRGLPSA